MTRWLPVRSSAAWAGLVAAALCGAGCGGTVEPPSEYAQFASEDGAFALDYPSGWDSKSGARPDNTYSWAEFSRGGATIRVIADTAGSLMADVAKAFGGGEEDGDFSPVAQAHETKRDLIAEDFSNYREGPPETVTTQFGATRIAKFAAGGGVGGRRVGYRCTMLTNNRRITVLCHCPAAQFERLKPAFEKVILSVRRG